MKKFKKKQVIATTNKPLNSVVIEGVSASESILKEMWRLRLDFLNLSISEKDDWIIFRQNCRKRNTVLVNFYDQGGKLQGYYTFFFNPVKHASRRALLVHAKYYYVRPDYRGNYKFTFSSLKLIPGLIRRYGLRPIYLVAFSFPTSYVSLSRTFGSAMAAQEDSIPEWEKFVLESYSSAENGSNWDDERKLIVNQNVPIGEDRPASLSVRHLKEHYQAMNPQWNKGISLPIMMKFDFATLKNVIKTNVRRKIRR